MASIHSDFWHGNLDAAKARAVEARSRFSSDSSAAWDFQFRLLEAEILTYQGRGREVSGLLDCDASGGKGAGDLRIKWDLLCGLSELNSAPAAAEAKLQEARRIAQSSASLLSGEVLRTEALAQLHHNRLPEAAALFAQSRDAARAQSDAFLEASDLLNLGFVALEQDHFDEALTWLSAAEAAARPIDARPVLEAASGNIGWAYFNLGDFEKALANFQLAEREAQAIGTYSAQVDWLVDAGLAYFKLGDFAAAKATDERALAAARDLHSVHDIVNIESNLAFLLLQQGDIETAKAHTEAAARESGSLGDSPVALYPKFLQALLTERSARPQDAEELLLRVHDAAANRPALRWEIENALARHYGQHDPQRAEAWYRRSLETFESQRSSVADEELKLSFFGNGDTLYADYSGFLIDSHRAEDALRLLDRGRARTLEEGLGIAQTGTVVDARDPREAARRAKATLLFYSLGETKSYLWAIDARRIALVALPKRTEIEALVKTYQKAILRSADPLRDANPTAKALFDMLVAPAAALIPPGSRVLLVPDGILHGLNFETLLAPSADGAHYWIEDVTLTDISSLWIAASDTAPASIAQNALLLIGDPIPADTQFDRLSNASAEIALIRQHFLPQRQRVLARSAAVPAAYAQSEPATFTYIHFVAHGVASRLSPLDSAVVLSAPPGALDAYKLYARDIVRQPLHAQLVTISACYGSGMRTYVGEGLVGLSWAFLRAGAHHVISALWEASDASTPQLMDRLYSELDHGNAPDVALRTAKLSLMQTTGPFRKPLYWGAFQLYGGS